MDRELKEIGKLNNDDDAKKECLRGKTFIVTSLQTQKRSLDSRKF